MTRAEFETKSFEEVMKQLNEESDQISGLEKLKDFAKYQIDNGNYFLAKHIVEALQNGNDEKWWDYDFCMGTIVTPTPIKKKKM